MFRAFLITYELRNTATVNYNPLFEGIKKTKWWHYLPNIWIVITTEDSLALQTRLFPLIYQNDSLLIIEIKKNFGGWLPTEAWQWIKENVPN